MKRAAVPGGVAGGVLGIVTLGVYVAIIVAEGNDSVAEVAPWAGAMLGASVGAIAGSWLLPRRLGRLLLRAVAVVFLIVGFVAIFSIGVLPLVAGVLCLVTSERSASAPPPPLNAAHVRCLGELPSAGRTERAERGMGNDR